MSVGSIPSICPLDPVLRRLPCRHHALRYRLLSPLYIVLHYTLYIHYTLYTIHQVSSTLASIHTLRVYIHYTYTIHYTLCRYRLLPPLYIHYTLYTIHYAGIFYSRLYTYITHTLYTMQVSSTLASIHTLYITHTLYTRYRLLSPLYIHYTLYTMQVSSTLASGAHNPGHDLCSWRTTQ
jgi:hypothetical protein